MQLLSTCLGLILEMSSGILGIDKSRKYRSELRSLWDLTPQYLTEALEVASRRGVDEADEADEADDGDAL